MSPTHFPDARAGGWRTFLALWGSQSVSQIGSYVAWFALNVYVAQTLYPDPAQKAPLALALGAFAIAATLGAVLLAPVAGSVADRTPRRRVMLVCDVLSGLLTLGLFVLMTAMVVPFWLLFAFVVVTQALSIFHEAALESSYAMIVPEEQLTRANGMMQTTRQFGSLLAPTLATLLIGVPALLGHGPAAGGWLAHLNSGVPFALLVDGASFLIAAAFLARLPIPSPPPAEDHGGAAANLKADTRLGWTYLLRRPPLLHLLFLAAALNFATAAIPVYQTLLTTFTLEPDRTARGLSFAATLAIIQTVTSAGMFLGGLAISTWGGLKRRRVLGILLPSLLSGAGLVLMGLSGNVYLTAAAFALAVFVMPITNAHSAGIWQRQVPRELQGRVFAVRRMVARFTVPLGMAFVSGLSTTLPPGPVIAALGVLVIVISGLQLLNPTVQRVEDKAYLEALAAARGEGPSAARGKEADSTAGTG
ncbi:major facilitator superfamily transporter [Deinococcus phoenicis]|uniref:Major facilitator superfamily transporter n=1 Tax=Deinococcus phoenicis TaxID=1476583 RepID=A0A016QPX3_9DEIO|nr:MFS transporter [Deinococcus phoenicis]EYB67834.1 major facilitator superfamily transporter [Deinococcus phoenicis]